MFTSWRQLAKKKQLPLFKRSNVHCFNYSSLSKKPIHHSVIPMNLNDRTHRLEYCLQQLSFQATFSTLAKLKKNGSRLTQASSAYVRRRRRMWVGEELKHSHSSGTTQSNNFRTILFNVLPLFNVFLSRSLPPSLPAIYHLLLSRSPSSRLQLGAAAGPHIMATFICGSLPHAFIFSFTSFLNLSQRRAHIYLADKRFTSDLFQLISIFFHPCAELTTP